MGGEPGDEASYNCHVNAIVRGYLCNNKNIVHVCVVECMIGLYISHHIQLGVFCLNFTVQACNKIQMTATYDVISLICFMHLHVHVCVLYAGFHTGFFAGGKNFLKQ